MQEGPFPEIAYFYQQVNLVFVSKASFHRPRRCGKAKQLPQVFPKNTGCEMDLMTLLCQFLFLPLLSLLLLMVAFNNLLIGHNGAKQTTLKAGKY